MIQLHNDNLMARGRSRDCYLHPQDPGKVIKISTQKRGTRRDPNWQEWKHYRYMMKRHGHLDLISQCHGFVDTNLGAGLMCDCIRDFNGDVSRTLFEISSGRYHYDIQAIERALSDFVDNLIANNIQLFDFSLPNIAIQVLANDRYHPICIDLKGRFNNREFIPVSTYIPFISRKKLARRGHRLLETVRQFSNQQRGADIGTRVS